MTDACEVLELVKVTEGGLSASTAPSPETDRVVAVLRAADVSLAEALVRTFAVDAPLDAHEGELDFIGSRACFVAADGSEGTEWVLRDGSVVRFTEIDGWSGES